MKEFTRYSFLIGEKHTTKFGAQYEIIGYLKNPRKRIIRFLNGEEKTVLTSSISLGNVQSRYDKTVFGVGFIGEFDGVASNHPLYYRWTGMIGRCYSNKHPQYRSYGAKGIFVEPYLLSFANYVSFVSSLNNYESLIQAPAMWQIDKDKKGGNCYSRDTISIIPAKENLELENEKKRYPVKMLNKCGVLVKVFQSITIAEQETGIHRGNISRSVRTGVLAGGYKWELAS